MTAGQALKHVCFKEFREADKSLLQGDPLAGTTSQMSAGGGAGVMRLTQRGPESKFSDNVSEGSYQQKQLDPYKTSKKLPQNSNSFNDLNSKNQTFASDIEESPSVQGGLTGTNLVSSLSP